MAAPVSLKPMTTEDLLAMPDDGIDRWLIDGELREASMTFRNRTHSSIMAEVTGSLVNWRRSRPEPRGVVVCGEAGIRLRRQPDTTFGVDVAYVSDDVVVQQTDETTLIEGPPTLVVEIISPNDRQDEIDEKIDACLRHGVRLVWLIDPHDRTVLAYEFGPAPRLFTEHDEISAEPHLPGFRARVADFFPQPDRPRPV